MKKRTEKTLKSRGKWKELNENLISVNERKSEERSAVVIMASLRFNEGNNSVGNVHYAFKAETELS